MKATFVLLQMEVEETFENPEEYSIEETSEHAESESVPEARVNQVLDQYDLRKIRGFSTENSEFLQSQHEDVLTDSYLYHYYLEESDRDKYGKKEEHLDLVFAAGVSVIVQTNDGEEHSLLEPCVEAGFLLEGFEIVSVDERGYITEIRINRMSG